jgi:hypothetical protein
MLLTPARIAFAIGVVVADANSTALATAQAPDLLLLRGTEYSILTNPLEPFLTMHPEKRPSSEIISTGSWRGYLATWAIQNGRFNLIKIEVLARKKTDDDSFDTEYVDATATVFPGQKTVFAEWFTGHVIIPSGKRVEYVHMGYGSTYKKYRLLRVERGVVMKEWRLNLDNFKKFWDSQFAAFERTEKYRTEFERMQKEGKRTDESIRSFLSSYYSEEYLRTIFNDVPTECSWDPGAPECSVWLRGSAWPPNNRLNPTVGPVTVLATDARPAPVPPAG